MKAKNTVFSLFVALVAAVGIRLFSAAAPKMIAAINNDNVVTDDTTKGVVVVGSQSLQCDAPPPPTPAPEASGVWYEYPSAFYICTLHAMFWPCVWIFAAVLRPNFLALDEQLRRIRQLQEYCGDTIVRTHLMRNWETYDCDDHSPRSSGWHRPPQPLLYRLPTKLPNLDIPALGWLDQCLSKWAIWFGGPTGRNFVLWVAFSSGLFAWSRIIIHRVVVVEETLGSYWANWALSGLLPLLFGHAYGFAKDIFNDNVRWIVCTFVGSGLGLFKCCRVLRSRYRSYGERLSAVEHLSSATAQVVEERKELEREQARQRIIRDSSDASLPRSVQRPFSPLDRAQSQRALSVIPVLSKPGTLNRLNSAASWDLRRAQSDQRTGLYGRVVGQVATRSKSAVPRMEYDSEGTARQSMGSSRPSAFAPSAPPARASDA